MSQSEEEVYGSDCENDDEYEDDDDDYEENDDDDDGEKQMRDDVIVISDADLSGLSDADFAQPRNKKPRMMKTSVTKRRIAIATKKKSGQTKEVKKDSKSETASAAAGGYRTRLRKGKIRPKKVIGSDDGEGLTDSDSDWKGPKNETRPHHFHGPPRRKEHLLVPVIVQNETKMQVDGDEEGDDIYTSGDDYSDDPDPVEPESEQEQEEDGGDEDYHQDEQADDGEEGDDDDDDIDLNEDDDECNHDNLTSKTNAMKIVVALPPPPPTNALELFCNGDDSGEGGFGNTLRLVTTYSHCSSCRSQSVSSASSSFHDDARSLSPSPIIQRRKYNSVDKRKTSNQTKEEYEEDDEDNFSDYFQEDDRIPLSPPFLYNNSNNNKKLIK